MEDYKKIYQDHSDQQQRAVDMLNKPHLLESQIGKYQVFDSQMESTNIQVPKQLVPNARSYSTQRNQQNVSGAGTSVGRNPLSALNNTTFNLDISLKNMSGLGSTKRTYLDSSKGQLFSNLASNKISGKNKPDDS